MWQPRSSKVRQSLIIKYMQNKFGQVIQQGVTWLEVQFKLFWRRKSRGA